MRSERFAHLCAISRSEHFAHHEEIERVEEQRERKYEGLAEDGIHAAVPDPANPECTSISISACALANDVPRVAEPEFKPGPKYTYTRARKDGNVAGQVDDWKRDAASKDEWGTGDGGYKRPKEAADRLRYVLRAIVPALSYLTDSPPPFLHRKNVPYKVSHSSPRHAVH
jgi:hypothetical protein